MDSVQKPNQSKISYMMFASIVFIGLVNYVGLLEASIIFYFLMYLYSGLQTFIEEDKLQTKLKRLKNKSCDGNFLLELICSNGKELIILTSAFQILSSLFIIYVIFSCKKDKTIDIKTKKNILDLIFLSYYVFLIVVTLVYYHDKTIPILNNISLLMAMIIIHQLWAKKL